MIEGDGKPNEVLREFGFAFDELITAVLHAARRLFGAVGTSVALLDEDGKSLVFYAAAGDSAHKVVGVRIPAGTGIAGWVVASGQPLAVEDVAKDPRFAQEAAEAIGYLPHSIMAVPLQTSRSMLGVIEILDWDHGQAGGRDQMMLLGSFAQVIALAIESSMVFSDLGLIFGADMPNARLVPSRTDESDSDLADLASEFKALAALGPRERRTATLLVRQFLEYAGAV